MHDLERSVCQGREWDRVGGTNRPLVKVYEATATGLPVLMTVGIVFLWQSIVRVDH